RWTSRFVACYLVIQGTMLWTVGWKVSDRVFAGPAQERRARYVRSGLARATRQLRLRDREPARRRHRDGGRHDLPPDAAHAVGWAGEDLSRGIEQRPAPQVLPAHQGRPRRARRAEGGMDRLHRRRRQSDDGCEDRHAGTAIARSRPMTRLEFLDTLRRRLAGLPQEEIDELIGD